MRQLLLFCLWIGFLSRADLKVIRTAFLESAKHKQAATNLAKKTDALCGNDNALILGYRGVSYIMKCKYVYNPFCKIRYFNDGKFLIEQAISKEPNNIELHFLRYSVQTNAPELLQYNDKIGEDKGVLLTFLQTNDTVDTDLYGIILDYMLNSGNCTKDELFILSKIKNKNL